MGIQTQAVRLVAWLVLSSLRSHPPQIMNSLLCYYMSCIYMCGGLCVDVRVQLEDVELELTRIGRKSLGRTILPGSKLQVFIRKAGREGSNLYALMHNLV